MFDVNPGGLDLPRKSWEKARASQPLSELVISYRALLRYLFNFESRPGVAPGTIKLFVIGSKYGEIIGEASPFPTQVPPHGHHLLYRKNLSKNDGARLISTSYLLQALYLTPH